MIRLCTRPSRIAALAAIAVSIVLVASFTTKARVDEESLDALAARCKALRAEALADVDREKPDLRRWDGELHRLMTDVGDRIGKQHCTTEKLTELLGPPNKIVKAGEFYVATRVPPDESHWVYWWRGGHDYLYFVVQKGRVSEAKWWFAGE